MTNISLQLFAKNIEELPRIFRVGDIIRVHRVNVNEFQNQMNLNGNVYINTAWVIFSGNPEYHHEYDISEETLKWQEKHPPGFIRLLDQDQEKVMQEEIKR